MAAPLEKNRAATAMPRKSSRAAASDAGKRTTRRSINPPPEPAKPEPTSSRKRPRKSPSPPPKAKVKQAAKTQPTKPQGRGRGRGKKVVEVEEEIEEEEPEEVEEVEEEEDFEVLSPKGKRGGKGKGRGRGAAKKETQDEPETSTKSPPAKRGRKGTASAEKTPPESTSRRRSGRGAKQEEEKEESEEEEPPKPVVRQKRKRSTDEAPNQTLESKKSKTNTETSKSKNIDSEKSKSKTKGSKPDHVKTILEPVSPAEPLQEAAEPEVEPGAASGESSASASVEATKPSHKKDDDLKSFVVIDMKDVPGPDSSQVTSAFPKHKEAKKETAKDLSTSSHQTVQKTKSEETAAMNHTGGLSVQDVLPVVKNASDSSSTSNTNGHQSNKETIPEAYPIDNETPLPEGADPLFFRELLPNKKIDLSSVDETKKFTVVSYNILADCHAKKASTVWIKPEHYSQEHRHKRLMLELEFLDADILCFQEVGPDYFQTSLLPALKGLGYDGEMIKRTDDYHDEGEATFYRTNRFTLSNNKSLTLNDLIARDLEMGGLDEPQKAAVRNYIARPAVMLITQLKCRKTDTVLTVGNIHVTYDKFEFQDMQCVQVASAVKEIVSLAGGSHNPHILCGDFNAWPGTPVYQLATEGYLNDDSMKILQAMPYVPMPDGTKKPLVNVWWRGFQHTANKLASAYATVMGKEPSVTAFSTSSLRARILDYVMASSDNMTICGVLQTAGMSTVKGGIPNQYFPSDHLSLKAELVFKTPTPGDV